MKIQKRTTLATEVHIVPLELIGMYDNDIQITW